MRYVVYVDRLFWLQAAQTMVLLLLTGTFLNRRISAALPRLAICSVAEALFFCVVYLTPGIGGGIKNILFAACALVMLCAAFRIHTPRLFLRVSVIYHGAVFFLGGLWYVCGNLPFLRGEAAAKKAYTLPSAACALLMAAFAASLWSWKRKREETAFADVELIDGEARIALKGLIDSGNGLYDPISHRPVSVVERACLEGCVELERPEKFRVIFYHTLGGEGMMQAFEIEKLKVKWEGQDWVIEKALLGLYDGKIAKSGGYQMILHPALLKMGGKT